MKYALVFLFVFISSFIPICSQEAANTKVGDFVLVEGGSFQRNADVNSISNVSSFYIGKYEITQKQYKLVMGTNPSTSIGDNLPVGNVNFYDVIVFCNAASLMDNLQPVYILNNSRNPKDWGKVPIEESEKWNTLECDWNANGYRLPTEMEIAWASMGGIKDAQNRERGYLKRFSGDNGSNSMDDYCWHGFEKNAGKRIHDVGTRLPNELGIFDLSGNATEWIWDKFEKRNPEGILSDYHGPSNGIGHIAAGGCWLSQEVYLRVYLPFENKGALYSRAKFDYVGFRLAKNNNK